MPDSRLVRPAELLRRADVLAAAANRCRLTGAYVMADMYLGKALALRKRADIIGKQAERDQRSYDRVKERSK